MSSPTAAFDQFQATLNEYVAWNKRELGTLLQSRAKRLRYEIFSRFKALRPDRQKLRAALWVIAERGEGLRLHENPKTGRLRTRRQEITARVKSVGFLSVSFLPKDWLRVSQGTNTTAAARSASGATIGMVVDRTAPGRIDPFVAIKSFLAGAEAQNEERGIVESALAGQSADMAAYIAKKQAAQLARSKPSTTTVTI